MQIYPSIKIMLLSPPSLFIVVKIGATSRFCQSVANKRGKVDLIES